AQSRDDGGRRLRKVATRFFEERRCVLGVGRGRDTGADEGAQSGGAKHGDDLRCLEGPAAATVAVVVRLGALRQDSTEDQSIWRLFFDTERRRAGRRAASGARSSRRSAGRRAPDGTRPSESVRV